MTVDAAMKFEECSKIVVQSLTNWSNWNNWGSGPYWNGLLDECDLSDDQTVTLYSWNPIQADKEVYWRGDGTSADCWPGLIFGWLSPYLPTLMHLIFEQ